MCWYELLYFCHRNRSSHCFKNNPFTNNTLHLTLRHIRFTQNSEQKTYLYTLTSLYGSAWCRRDIWYRQLTWTTLWCPEDIGPEVWSPGLFLHRRDINSKRSLAHWRNSWSGDVKVSIYKQTRASLSDNLDANWMREMRDFVNRLDTRFFIYERKTRTC